MADEILVWEGDRAGRYRLILFSLLAGAAPRRWGARRRT